MRPIAHDQDLLRNPLNEVLGTRANVRLMRLLASEGLGSVKVPEAAARTGLTEAGARRALRRLVESGLVERTGGRRAQQFRLRESAPLTPHIRELFAAERQRHQELILGLRDVFSSLPDVRTAWIEATPTEPGSPLHLGVIGDVRSLASLGQEVRRRIVEIEREYDLTIEIHTYSPADAPELEWRRVEVPAAPVDGPSPASGAPRGESAERAMRLSRAIADQLARDESMVGRAIAHVDFLLQQDQGAATRDLEEWRDILTAYPLHRLRDFLVSDTPRAERLRRSAPFFAVLRPDERDALLAVIEAGA